MPVLVKCPHCNFETVAADHFSGRSGPCANCGRIITVLELDQDSPKPPSRPRGNLVTLISAGVLFGIVALFALFLVLRNSLSNSNRVNSQMVEDCQSNLDHISKAIRAYEQQFGHYPPAYTVDQNGRPLHSWRVLILPFLDEESLYSQIDLSEPWDSPKNALLHAQMPDVFRCPAHVVEVGKDHFTNYFVIQGEEFLFDGEKKRTKADVVDDHGTVITVVEVESSQTVWMEPTDKYETPMMLDIGQNPRGISSPHDPSAANVGRLDGEPELLRRREFSSIMIRSMLTIDGRD